MGLVIDLLKGPLIHEHMVGYNHLLPELSSIIDLHDPEIDWSIGIQFNYTMTVNTTFTFTNLKAGKTIAFWLKGNYTATLPGERRSGVYDPSRGNLILFYCIETTTPTIYYSIL